MYLPPGHPRAFAHSPPPGNPTRFPPRVPISSNNPVILRLYDGALGSPFIKLEEVFEQPCRRESVQLRYYPLSGGDDSGSITATSSHTAVNRGVDAIPSVQLHWKYSTNSHENDIAWKTKNKTLKFKSRLRGGQRATGMPFELPYCPDYYHRSVLPGWLFHHIDFYGQQAHSQLWFLFRNTGIEEIAALRSQPSARRAFGPWDYF